MWRAKVSYLLRGVPGLVLLLLVAGCASRPSPYARGYEMRLRYAEVVALERVALPSSAPAGAVVGGFTGLILSRNRSARSQVAGAIGGAALGGLATRALEGDRRGYGYTLRFTDGSSSRFITEKGYLRTGDCVVVEQGQYANVRRVAETLCGARPDPVVERKLQLDAEQCHAAKTELLAASTNETIDAAARKVEILCQY